MAGHYSTPMKATNIRGALEILEFLNVYITKRGISIFVAALLLGLAGVSAAQDDWTNYKNSRFGYSLSLPSSLVVSNRAADGSGVTWQTGTVRVQVSGTNNPYQIKPHEYFSGVKGAAGERVVEEDHGSDSSGYWYEILYTKDSRRVHRKIYIAGGSINSIEYSYGYRYREDKEVLARRVIATFKPGDLTAGH